MMRKNNPENRSRKSGTNQTSRNKMTTRPASAKLKIDGPIPRFLGISLRWALFLVIMSLLAGSVSAYRISMTNTDKLAAELNELELERAILQDDLKCFSDPEWRKNYWKWRLMRHEAGERYIDFVEPGIL